MQKICKLLAPLHFQVDHSVSSFPSPFPHIEFISLFFSDPTLPSSLPLSFLTLPLLSPVFIVHLSPDYYTHHYLSSYPFQNPSSPSTLLTPFFLHQQSFPLQLSSPTSLQHLHFLLQLHLYFIPFFKPSPNSTFTLFYSSAFFPSYISLLLLFLGQVTFSVSILLTLSFTSSPPLLPFQIFTT